MKSVTRGSPSRRSGVARLARSRSGQLAPSRAAALGLAGLLAGLMVADGASGERSDHWAYLRPRRPDLPAVRTVDWPLNPLDRFVLARLEAAGLEPSPPAELARLVRRVHLALVGLPPSPEVVDRVLADPSPDAYERLVDRLLASAAFGERWARPWLDLARYADSNGFQADQLRESWPYRDWVIDAMNADMAFDRFTVEQLAGDLLPEPGIDQLIATGFHRTVTCNVEAGVDPEENRINQVVDRVDTTGTVWLGTTVGCARCHDHKYDPITQEEYYRLFAYFNNTPLEVRNPTGKGVRFDFWGPKMELPLSPAKAAERTRLRSVRETLAREIGEAERKARRDQESWERDPGTRAKLPEAISAILARGERSAAERRALEQHYLAMIPEVRELRGRLEDVETRLAALAPATTLVMVELDEPRTTRVLLRGDHLRPGETVAPGTPAALHRPRGSMPRDRLGLARWLVQRDNPLVARVTVNRWWAELMGRGMVTTPEDFGARGAPPTHPGLLDWLAVELVESGWSRKHVLRLVVTSATFRQSSRRLSPALLERDPGNELYARGPRLRMGAEMIRDNALAISGLLSRAMGGPPVFPPQPPGLWRQTGRNEPVYRVAEGERRYRRGVYVVWRRAAPYPSFVNFDAPDRAACVVTRSRTNTPLQALTLMNDPAHVEMALALAGRVLEERPEATVRERVRRAFRLALSREPGEPEARYLELVLARELERLQAAPGVVGEILENRPRPELGAALDGAELAAWYFVATILLNLDETITRQ